MGPGIAQMTLDRNPLLTLSDRLRLSVAIGCPLRDAMQLTSANWRAPTGSLDASHADAEGQLYHLALVAARRLRG